MHVSGSGPRANHKRLYWLQPAYFQHPLDKATTENLAKVKDLDLLKVHGAGAREDIPHTEHLELPLSEREPGVQHLQAVVEVCEVLQVPPLSLFIQNDPYPNVYT
jgi:hypothetical protein